MYIYYIYYIYTYIYIYIYIDSSSLEWSTTCRVFKSHKTKIGRIYTCNHESNVPSWYSPKWLCGNSCHWSHDVHHMWKCMSCHKAIVMITGRAHFFLDCIYNYICVYIYYIYIYIYIYVYKYMYIYL